MRALKISHHGYLLSLGFSNAALAETKLTVGVALPRAQLGRATAPAPMSPSPYARH